VTIVLAGMCVAALILGPGRWAGERDDRPKTAADARQSIRLAALNEAARVIREGDPAFLARIDLDGTRRIPGLDDERFQHCFASVTGTVSISNDPRLYPDSDPRRYELYFEVFNAAMLQHLSREYGSDCPGARR